MICFNAAQFDRTVEEGITYPTSDIILAARKNYVLCCSIHLLRARAAIADYLS